MRAVLAATGAICATAGAGTENTAAASMPPAATYFSQRLDDLEAGVITFLHSRFIDYMGSLATTAPARRSHLGDARPASLLAQRGRSVGNAITSRIEGLSVSSMTSR